MPSPIDAVTDPDPYPFYATLVAQRPFYYDESLRMWVASDAATVAAILSHPGCRVRPPSEPVPPGIVGTPAGDVFGQLVRMTDGARQQRVKRLIVAALSQARTETVAALAADRAAFALKASEGVPRSELMFAVPAQVLAGLCGLDTGGADQATRLIGEFVQCIPASATAAQQAAAARAASELQQLMGPLLDERGDGLLGELVRAADRADRHDPAALLANGIGLLSQTYDATAGLIGNTLVALARLDGVRPPAAEALEPFVREVVRHDAPIQNTRRFTAEPVRQRDHEVAAGQAILLVLAAANRDPAVNDDPDAFRPDRPAPAVFTFGAGAHRCPGETLAVTITTAVVGALLARGYDPSDLPEPVSYRPLANARIPVL